jgi:hypothetical protein
LDIPLIAFARGSGVESFVGNLGGVGGDTNEYFGVLDDSTKSFSFFSSFESRNMELLELIDYCVWDVIDLDYIINV